MGTLIGVVLFVVLLLLLIGFHEFGHFITARLAGIKVTRFFLGFGPTLWSTRRGPTEVVEDEESGELVERPETEYGVKALPVGGFVKILGMGTFDLPEDLPPEDRPRSFQAAPAWKRAVVLSAGSVTHFITAFVFLFLIFTAIGLPGEVTPRVAEVSEEIDGGTSPAARAGLQRGDEIVALDGERISGWEEVTETVRSRPGEEIRMTVLRDGERLELDITPATVTQDGERIGMVGVLASRETERLGPVDAAVRSGEVLGESVVMIVRATPQAFSPDNLGLVPGQPRSEDATGVSIVGAGRWAGDLIDRGQIAGFLSLFVSIHLFVGMLNMLPLPPLDGGHLLLLAIEKVRGKPVGARAVLPVMAIVMSLLIALAVVLLFQDIFSPVNLPQ